MRYISGKTVDEVIKVYSSNNSILETAKVTGLSTVKVRKILITEGLWERQIYVFQSYFKIHEY